MVKTFKAFGVEPTYMQLNKLSNGNIIRSALQGKVQQTTVPYVYIDGVSTSRPLSPLIRSLWAFDDDDE
jgi:glutaredoxin